MRAVVALVLLCLAAPSVAAQKLDTIRVKIKRGDTLELLAAEYYGDRQHAVFIMKANRMTHPRKLRPGQKIKIPIQREITTSVGDTLEGLAEEYMGDARRAEFLAAFNNLADDARIEAGRRVIIPFHVVHKAASRETLESIAAAYLGDSKKADLLQRYNFTEKAALAPGEKLVIPIFNVRVRPEKLPAPDASSTEREARLREMEERAVSALPNARALWRSGEYAAVKKALVDIDMDYLPVDAAAEVGMLLAAAYIAFDDNDSALATFDKVLQRKPAHEISSHDHSPKVRDVWTKAGGKVTD